MGTVRDTHRLYAGSVQEPWTCSHCYGTLNPKPRNQGNTRATREGKGFLMSCTLLLR